MHRLFKTIIFSAALCIPALAVVSHADDTITATLHQTEIEAGESAQLTVTLSTGTDAGKPLLPDVKGLRFIPRGQSTRMQFVNGRMSTNVTFVYEIQALDEGVYTIPPVQIRLSGRIIETDPMTLSVTGGARSRLPAMPPSSGLGTFGFGPPAPSIPAPRADSAGQAAALTVHPAKTTAYAGELLPVEIRASFAEAMRVTLNSQPALSGGAFTVQNTKGEPHESREVSNGRTYTVLTWRTAISAAKDGTFPVTGELAATFLVKETMRMRNPFLDNPLFDNNFFDQDLFDNFFGGLKEKSVTLKSDELYLRILPLPEEGKPSSFNGAIGSFSMSVSSSPAAVRTGDPVTLRVRISGTGNFDRVSKPSVETDANWKTYNPEATFKPLDAVGFQGEKFFEQVLIPQSPDIKEIPPLVFTWFDPVQRKYNQIKSDPLPLTVTGPAITTGRTLPSAPSPAVVPEAGQPPLPTDSTLAPIQIESGPGYASLTPVFMQSWYLQAAGTVLLLILAGIGGRMMVLRRMKDPGYARRLSQQTAIDAAFNEIEKALHEADTRAFLLAGKRAGQLMLADKWRLEPEAITISDIKSRSGDEFPETLKIFELSDAVSFSGHSLNVQQLREIFKAFKDELGRVK